MGMMQFLGETGGYQAAITLIASLINFLFSGNNQAFELLDRFFLINSTEYHPKKQTQWLSSFRKTEFGRMDRFIFGTALKFAPFLAKCNRTARTKRLLNLADSEIAQTLDLRTIIRSQSYLLAVIRAVIDKENYDLLTMQSNNKYLQVPKHKDRLSSLLFDTSDDATTAVAAANT